jgi:starch-binding outer membrane protein, SusD/RagB family
MKNIFKLFILITVSLSSFSCKKEILDTESQTILSDDQIWKDPALIKTVLANLYDRLPRFASITSTINYQIFDEAMYSGISNSDRDARNRINQYGTGTWTYWDYGLLRDIHVAIDQVKASTAPTVIPLKDQVVAELRFIRAMVYFELVKRMGGVPLVTTQLIYDFKGDVTHLQTSRSKEEEIYDFIAKETDEIKNIIGNTGNVRRANKYAVLALKSRAMLYAGSLAKYNNASANPIKLAGGVLGISASRATEYYQKSLDASKEILDSAKLRGVFKLYETNSADRTALGENFWKMLTDKTSANKEVILANDYNKAQARFHAFTADNIVPSLREAGVFSGSETTPSLNLVESFEYTDNPDGTLKGVGDGTDGGQANWIYYDKIDGIFANKDARLYGTVIYPGTSFRNTPVKMLTGKYTWNGSKYVKQNVNPGGVISVAGVVIPGGRADGALVNDDGPAIDRQITHITNSGFYMRKYIDAASGASTPAGSDMWWVMFRLGEIYLNASEAAFELGNTTYALENINAVRKRAGFTNDLASLTIGRIQNERRVELAFEDHRLWDVIRWRIGDQVWSNLTINALYPYVIDRPGHPNHGKYVFDKIEATRMASKRSFLRSNYYASIPQSAINNSGSNPANPGGTNVFQNNY